MSNALQTYLADHLAGSLHAIELIKNLRDEYGGQELGQLAGNLLREIEPDRQVLDELARRVGGGPSTIKEATAWAGERLSRLKLRHDGPASLGTFEALEHLSLGILGKLALWRGLMAASAFNVQLRGPDYEALAQRAVEQHNAVEQKRLHLAAEVFRGERN